MADGPLAPVNTGMSGMQDVNTTLQIGNQNLAAQFQALIAALGTVFPRVSSVSFGSFTCSAAATTTVSDTTVAANSFIDFVPTNAAAATLQAGTSSLYLSGRTADTSFSVATATGSAAGTETFIYFCVTP